MRAHPAGPATPTSSAKRRPSHRPPTSTRLVAHVWSSGAEARRPTEPWPSAGIERLPRHGRHGTPGLRARRGGLPQPGPRACRRLRRRRRLLREQGIQQRRHCCAGWQTRGSGSTSRPAASWPSPSVPASRWSGCSSTATTSRSPSSTRAVRTGRRSRRHRLDRRRSGGWRGARRRPVSGSGCWCGSRSASRPTPTSSSPRRTRTRSSASRSRRAQRRGRSTSCSLSPSLELVGVHSHIGSQIFDTSGFEVAAHRAVELARRDPGRATASSWPSSTSGAASGSPTSSPTTRPTSPTSRRACATIVDRECRAYELAVPRLAVEPGRALVGPEHGDRLRGRDGQAGRARRRGRRAPTSASTAA